MIKKIFYVILLISLTTCHFEQKIEKFESSGSEKYMKDDYEGALIDFNKHIEKFPNDTSAYLNRAKTKAMLNDYKGSLLDNSKTIELDPTNQKGFYNRALDKTKLKDYEGAINDYSILIKLNPKNLSEIYQKRGSVRQQIFNDEGAIHDFSKAIEIDPGNTDAYVSRAISNIDNTKEAFIDLDKAIEIDKRKGSAYFIKGVIHLNLNDNEKACNYFEKAIYLDYEPTKTYFEKFCSNSSQKYFIDQKIELYKSNYLYAINNTIKNKFLDKTKTLTKRILDSLNYSIFNWEGDIDMVMLGNKASDVKLLKQGLTPNQVKKKDPENRPINIVISSREKTGNGSYNLFITQEQNKNYEGGIKPSNILYSKALKLKKGDKILFSAKVRRIEEHITDQENSTLFMVELTNLK